MIGRARFPRCWARSPPAAGRHSTLDPQPASQCQRPPTPRTRRERWRGSRPAGQVTQLPTAPPCIDAMRQSPGHRWPRRPHPPGLARLGQDGVVIAPGPLCLAIARNRPARSREEALRRSPKGRRSTSSPGDQPHEDQEQHGALRVGVEQGHKAREGEDEFHPSGMLRRRARDWHQSSAPAESRGLPTLAAQAQKPGAEARVPNWD